MEGKAGAGAAVTLAPSAVGVAMAENKEDANYLAAKMEEDDVPADVKANAYKYNILKDAVFVGHLNTDMDSIASAIGAAELFAGTAASASEVNSETAFALKRWGLETPPYFPEMDGVADRNICLMVRAFSGRRMIGVGACGLCGGGGEAREEVAEEAEEAEEAEVG